MFTSTKPLPITQRQAQLTMMIKRVNASIPVRPSRAAVWSPRSHAMTYCQHTFQFTTITTVPESPAAFCPLERSTVEHA